MCYQKGKPKNQRKDPSQSTHINLIILQWNARGLSQNKKTKLHLNLVKHDVDVFAIMEANLMTEKLIYYQLNGYTLPSLPKYKLPAAY
jgi:hypothetical protein